MMTGTGDMVAMRRKTARPCESANCMSSRMSDGEAEATRATPSSPLVAVTTSNPSTDRVAARESRDWVSSSMMRMVGCPSGGSTGSSTSRNAKVIVDRWRSGAGRRPPCRLSG